VLLALMLTAGLASAQSSTPPVVDWTQMLNYDQMSQTLQDLNTAYPNMTKLFSIGHSWQERQLWCLQLSAPIAAAKNKTSVALFGNIHGGEQQGGMGAAYTAWWLATQYGKDPTATKILSKYNVYIVPLINPDGYQQSFISSTRQNMRPTDRNGIAGPFSDPYFDTNGDGVIAQIYKGPAGLPQTGATPEGVTRLHSGGVTDYESRDFDQNGIFGDDAMASLVDMNRNFDYLWNYHDVTTTPPLGQNAWATAGPNAASEPEVQAVQNFLATHPVAALTSLHTGEQSVLWPWCYTHAPSTDNAFMKATSEKMAAAWATTTGRGMYTMQSYDDYPTSSELIDWSWGRLHINSYTQEVYVRGNGNDPNFPTWGDTTPPDQWLYVGDWQGLHDIWFRNTGSAQLAGKAVPQQDKLVAGVKDSFVVMALSEPSGTGAIVPDWIIW
jgi:hypothetical protein